MHDNPVSPTPDSVMGEVVDNICEQWNVEDAWQALPYGLSYAHASHAMAWGQEFLILLSDLAGLTPGKLAEVQESLRERIDHGRETKASRHSWVMPGDVKALIERYERTRLGPTNSARRRMTDDEQEVREQYRPNCYPSSFSSTDTTAHHLSIR